jgi:hypothetical protein
MVMLMTSLISAGHDVTFITGRPLSNRHDTVISLWNAMPILSTVRYTLLTRTDGDPRSLSLIKLAWCQERHPQLVLEDEPETVRILKAHGFTVLQVHGYRVDEFKDNIPE